MAQSFDCPSCGAPLDYDGGGDTMRCPYCDKSIIVPEELRARPAPPRLPGSTGGFDLNALIGQAPQFKEVARLARSGQKIEAIKLYRLLTNAGLKEAKEAVEAIEAGQPIALTSQSSISISSPTATGEPISEILRLLREDNKLEAIKLYRQAYDVDLSTAKAAVEGMEQAQAPIGMTSRLPTGRPRRRGGCCSTLGVILFLFVTVGLPILLPIILSNQAAISRWWNKIDPNAFARETLRFGKEGTGPGMFDDVRSIAVDPSSGNIYAGDYQGGRVQAFDASGKFINQWMVGDAKSMIFAMAADRKGVVYVASGGKILRYEGASGKLLGELSYNGEHPYFESLTATADGGLAAITDGEEIVRFNSDGEVTLTIPAAISTVSGDSELDTRLAIDGLGNIYALGTFNNAVFKFSPEGKYLNRFGSEGEEAGQFRAPYAIAVDGNGRVYVSDIFGVQVFDASGRYIRRFKVPGVAFGLVFDDQNNLYVASNSQLVLKYTIKAEKAP